MNESKQIRHRLLRSPVWVRQCIAFFALVATSCSWGCRAQPLSIAATLIGDSIHDSDVKKRHAELKGKAPESADKMFGARVETLADTRRPKREILIYKVKGDLLDVSRYLVEVNDGKIVAVSRKSKDKDGVEDVVKGADLRNRLIGKSPTECQREGKLGNAMLVLRSKEKGTLVRVYDASNWTHFGGARYCVLRFNSSDRCESINLVGLDASSKPGGLIQGGR